MTASSYLDLSRFARAPAAARLWRLRDGAAVPLDGAAAGRDVVAVPTEQVALLAVDLPLPTHRQRIEALPFAVEDRIADPLAAVHLALGGEMAPRRYLAAVVRHEVMRDWLAAIGEAGLERAALVPDALLLPHPDEGGWTVRIDGARAIVRSGDGAGFALPAARLEQAWAAAGRPACIAEGGVLPPALRLAAASPEIVAEPVTLLDLRQGRYAARRAPLSGIARRVVIAAAAGVAAHACIATVDTALLRHVAARKQAETRALAIAAIPSIGPDDDFVGIVAARLPAATRASPDRLLPLLARVSSTLGGGGPVRLRGMTYEGRSLALEVEPGSERLLAARLAAAGLAATVAPGRLLIADAAS